MSSVTDSTEHEQVISSLKSSTYRHVLVSEYIQQGVSFQIRANRVSRHLSQEDLGKLAEMKQTAVCRLEDPNHMPTLRTLLRVAEAFDVALIVKFAPFSDLVEWMTDTNTEKDLVVASYASDSALRKPRRSKVVSQELVTAESYRTEPASTMALKSFSDSSFAPLRLGQTQNTALDRYPLDSMPTPLPIGETADTLFRQISSGSA